jgi:hypothetical protein
MALEKAYFVQMDKNFKNEVGARVDVQFNPESLKVTYSNQTQQPQGAADQRGSASIQYVGAGTTKMSAQLWFDAATAPTTTQDVRTLTKKVVDFMTAQPIDDPGPTHGLYRPRFVKFNWGTFAFNGIIDSIEETVEYFSPDGLPQRASVTFSMVQQAIQFLFGQQRNSNSPGNAPLTSAPQGSSVQGMAAAAGRPGDWQSIAQANGIENPRMLATGQMLNMNADITGGIGVSAGTATLGNVSIGASGTAIGGVVGGSASVSVSGGFGTG